MDTQASFQSSRLQIQAIHNSVEKLKDVADRMIARALGWSCVKRDFKCENLIVIIFTFDEGERLTNLVGSL